MSNAYLDYHKHEWEIIMPTNSRRLWLEAWCTTETCDVVLMIDEIERRLNLVEEEEDE